MDPRALLYLCAFLAPRRPHRQPGPRPRLPAADRIIATALAGTMGGTSGISMMLIELGEWIGLAPRSATLIITTSNAARRRRAAFTRSRSDHTQRLECAAQDRAWIDSDDVSQHACIN